MIFTFADGQTGIVAFAGPAPEPPRCRCWNPAAREHQYDCPVAAEGRERARRAKELIELLTS